MGSRVETKRFQACGSTAFLNLYSPTMNAMKPEMIPTRAAYSDAFALSDTVYVARDSSHVVAAQVEFEKAKAWNQISTL
jgi:hypothetical protein